MGKEHKYDMAAMGECLIDFAPAARVESGKLSFEGSPGGAPANVMACASKLGWRTAFIGKVGKDVFGAFLKDTLDGCGIETSPLILSEDYPTTLAFVSLGSCGERSFSFYRNKTADGMVLPEELNETVLSDCRIFHFGSVSMTTEPARGTTFAAVEKAKGYGALISYDPNLREPLWDSMDDAKKVITHGLEYADLVKLSEGELMFLSGEAEVEKGMEKLYRQYGMQLLAVTCGAEGALCMCRDTIYRSPAFRVDAIDTTGAGDVFWGAFLWSLRPGCASPNDMDITPISLALQFANAAGALSTTKRGAIPALPTLEEIRGLMEAQACV